MTDAQEVLALLAADGRCPALNRALRKTQHAWHRELAAQALARMAARWRRLANQRSSYQRVQQAGALGFLDANLLRRCIDAVDLRKPLDDWNDAAVHLCWLVDSGLLRREQIASALSADQLIENGLDWLALAPPTRHSVSARNANPFFYLPIGFVFDSRPELSWIYTLVYAVQSQFSAAFVAACCECFLQRFPNEDLRLLVLHYGYAELAAALPGGAALTYVDYIREDLLPYSCEQVALLQRWYGAQLAGPWHWLRNSEFFYLHANHAHTCQA